MTEITATIRLRPTRIGFLVRPTDMTAVRKIMRACACLWGGEHNPIIPVYRSPPDEWRQKPFESQTGLSVAKGYVRFFEPDVFVESEAGLLEKAGLGSLREQRILGKQHLSLKEFLKPRYKRNWSEPAFGLSIHDVFQKIYDTEQRFQLKDPRPSVLVKPERSGGLVEAIFGAYPRQKDAAYFAGNYKDVFAPRELNASPASWLEVYERGARTPLQVTRFGIEVQRYWYHDFLVYLFDPSHPTDLIDLWNIRIEPHRVLPVPVDWFDDLADHIRRRLKAAHRPVRGNPSGVMHSGTVEFGRSIGEDRAEELRTSLAKGPAGGTFSVKHWRSRVWEEHRNDRMPQFEKLEATVEERRVTLATKNAKEPIVSFETLTPDFASTYGGDRCRWVNAVKISTFGAENIATVFPFNMFNRDWPRLSIGNSRVILGREGWIFEQKFKNWTESLTLMTKEDSIVGSLKKRGIDARLSAPGHIARQMLDHLGGLRDVHLLADLETIKLLNKMAGGLRRKSTQTETVEETFERRTASAKNWNDLIARRKQKDGILRLELIDFTERNIIRLGLETSCPNCQFENWHSLSEADYGIRCERCLNIYDFPQAQLREHNRNWHYRVVGPFSVPDYGRGSYGALLTLRVIQNIGDSFDEMTFSTAMDLKFDGFDAEVDLLAWRREEQGGTHNPPELVFGEAKSLGHGDLIKPHDLKQLKRIGKKLPRSYIVISVMRKYFTDSEKKILRGFVQWSRKFDESGQPSNLVILLTANELLFEHFISDTWKELGGEYDAYLDYDHTRNLYSFAEATQSIYLGLPTFFEQWAAEREKRTATKKISQKSDG